MLHLHPDADPFYARLQLAQKESEALASSIDRLERMLGALKGAIERGTGGT